jgi:hypothetical protein
VGKNSLPGARIIGLSKLGRVVELFSRDLQIQERLTTQVADWLQRELEPKGVGVVLRPSGVGVPRGGRPRRSAVPEASPEVEFVGKKGGGGGAKGTWISQPEDTPETPDKRRWAVERPTRSPGGAHGCARPVSIPR